METQLESQVMKLKYVNSNTETENYRSSNIETFDGFSFNNKDVGKFFTPVKLMKPMKLMSLVKKVNLERLANLE